MLMRIFAFLCLLLLSPLTHSSLLMKANQLDSLNYDKPFFPDEYNKEISTLDQLLDFPYATRAASPEQIHDIIAKWAEQSQRMKLVEYARSYEGRPLHYLVISDPANLKKLPEIKKNIQLLKDARKTDSGQAKKIIETLPAIAWFGYSIHGNESSGSDAALAFIYQLIASQSNKVGNWLKGSIIIVDPNMNPDGRARFVNRRQEARGTAPNIDVQSTLHTGTWPYGRANHYYFDLNRDFLMGVHPESMGRIMALNEWRPQLMIDAHEMGALDTFLFSPSREPINDNIPQNLRKWGKSFAQDQARGFDASHWPYYTGEWFENFYPGYSNIVEYKGSMHILYEQARLAEDGIRGYNGQVTSYKQSVHHQYVSSLLNLESLHKNSKALYKDYYEHKKTLVSLDFRHANRSFVIMPTENHSRLKALTDALTLHGLEVYQTTKEVTVSGAINQLHETVNYLKVPKGAVVVPNGQPDGDLVSALLEFDASLKDQVLIKERQARLRDGSSIMYDTTAWNLTMMLGLEAYTLDTTPKNNLEPFSPRAKLTATPKFTASAIGYAVNGHDDRSLGFAAQLLEQGLKVRALDKTTVLANQEFVRGSIFIQKSDNKPWTAAIEEKIAEAAIRNQLKLRSVTTGLGDGDFPDIGGSHFRLLKKPQVALLTGSPINSLDFGTVWFSIDKYLGIRHSHLHMDNFLGTNLQPYNTLVIPSAWGQLDEKIFKKIRPWLMSGGTLIVIGHSASAASKHLESSDVETLPDGLKNADEYDIALRREWLAGQELSTDMLSTTRSHSVTASPQFPFSPKAKAASFENLKRIDEWQSIFMPSGAILAGRSDQKHWLSFGTPAQTPLYFARHPVILSSSDTEAVVRMGIFQSVQENVWENIKKSMGADQDSVRINWATLPNNTQLKLRLSGLLWPEAAQRIANSSYLTREPFGQGQVIYFAGEPNFRAMALGTNRLLLNAIVLGSGLGSKHVIDL